MNFSLELKAGNLSDLKNKLHLAIKDMDTFHLAGPTSSGIQPELPLEPVEEDVIDEASLKPKKKGRGRPKKSAKAVKIETETVITKQMLTAVMTDLAETNEGHITCTNILAGFQVKKIREMDEDDYADAYAKVLKAIENRDKLKSKKAELV